MFSQTEEVRTFSYYPRFHNRHLFQHLLKSAGAMKAEEGEIEFFVEKLMEQVAHDLSGFTKMDISKVMQELGYLRKAQEGT